jgi:acetylornithine deacetylase/succinyl-diaminopimelate desuccinylase-like protein
MQSCLRTVAAGACEGPVGKAPECSRSRPTQFRLTCRTRAGKARVRFSRLLRQIEKLHTLNNVRRRTTGETYCTIRGGTTTNVIPEHAEFTVDVRFSAMDEAARNRASSARYEAVRRSSNA